MPRSSFYRWYRAYVESGYEGLAPREPQQQRFWNQIPDSEREKVVEIALAKPELSPHMSRSTPCTRETKAGGSVALHPLPESGVVYFS